MLHHRVRRVQDRYRADHFPLVARGGGKHVLAYERGNYCQCGSEWEEAKYWVFDSGVYTACWVLDGEWCEKNGVSPSVREA